MKDDRSSIRSSCDGRNNDIISKKKTTQAQIIYVYIHIDDLKRWENRNARIMYANVYYDIYIYIERYMTLFVE
jgi:hypothetical protein